jgi:hypothetical protein
MTMMTMATMTMMAAAGGRGSARAGQRMPEEACTLARHRCHQLDPTAAATKAAQRPLVPPLPAPPPLADLLCVPAPLPWCQVLVPQSVAAMAPLPPARLSLAAVPSPQVLQSAPLWLALPPMVVAAAAVQRPLVPPLPALPLLADLLCVPVPLPWCQALFADIDRPAAAAPPALPLAPPPSAVAAAAALPSMACRRVVPRQGHLLPLRGPPPPPPPPLRDPPPPPPVVEVPPHSPAMPWLGSKR